jgi:competence protein ComEA
MLKKLLLAVAVFIATMGFAFAQVDVNKADQAALDGVKGIGPKMSKSILDERKKNGDFKDWADFQKRVKGIGDKNSDKLSKAGLTVNGQSKANAPAAPTAKAETNKEAKTKEAKAEKSPAAGMDAMKNGADDKGKSKSKKETKSKTEDKASAKK